VEIGTKVEGVGHLLSDRLLAIPDYQRAYSWDEEEVSELWYDLSTALADGVSEYFLGSVVTTQGPGQTRHQVIDGQQRFATVSLLYAVLRDIFASRSDERAGDIEREVLFKQNMITRAREPRIVLNAEDNEVFRQLTLERSDKRSFVATQDSHRKLIGAFKFFERKFAELVDGLGPDQWQEPLLNWYAFVLQSARVIEVSVSDESRAFVIFETLNDRGLNLSTADLLKNHLFGQAGDRLEEAKLRWTQAMAPFSNVDGTLSADAFLRHFWASKQGVVRVKALYSVIKPHVNAPASAVGLAAELAQSGPLWVAMFDRDAELWSSYSPIALSALDALRNLNVEQCRPLLLAGLRKLPKKEMEKLLSLVVSWSVRWFVVGGGSAGVTERLYATAAKKVTDGELLTAAHIAGFFSESVPTDARFERAFQDLTVRRGWLARYYLAALEIASAGGPEPELVPNQNVEQVNLEHVLPRNPDPWDWPAFNAEELQGMRLLLGNQALLKKSHNTQIGNESFSVKRPIFAASELKLTSEIADYEEWTPGAIRDRQQRMAALAVGVWSRT
jgi:hypothetical protein